MNRTEPHGTFTNGAQTVTGYLLNSEHPYHLVLLDGDGALISKLHAGFGGNGWTFTEDRLSFQDQFARLSNGDKFRIPNGAHPEGVAVKLSRYRYAYLGDVSAVFSGTSYPSHRSDETGSGLNVEVIG